MTEKLARRRVSVPGEFRPDVMSTTPVREIMTTDVAAMPATSTVHDALDLVSARPHGAYPVVDDDGRCVGVVSRRRAAGVRADLEGRRARRRPRLGHPRRHGDGRAAADHGRGRRPRPRGGGRSGRRDVHADRSVAGPPRRRGGRRDPGGMAGQAPPPADRGVRRSDPPPRPDLS